MGPASKCAHWVQWRVRQAAWAGKAIYERCAELDSEQYSFDAVSRVLEEHERGCDYLYAYRCARQATKLALRTVELLPNMVGVEEEERTRLKRFSLDPVIDKARRDVSKALKDSTAAELPVAQVLESNAWVGAPREL